MKAVIQRVKRTTLSVDGRLVSEIPFGLAVYLGIKAGDERSLCAQMAGKISRLRIFEDDNGKDKAQELIDKANANGGKDNIAVIVVEPFTNEVKEC